MALNLDNHYTVEVDPAAEFVTKFLDHMGLKLASRPAIQLPTLIGAPVDMDMRTADQLHSEASRWLEFIERQLALIEAQHLLAKHNVATRKRRLQFLYKRNWVESLSVEELGELEKLEQGEVQLHAMHVSMKGVQSALNKVITKASRTITVHSKALPHAG